MLMLVFTHSLFLYSVHEIFSKHHWKKSLRTAQKCSSDHISGVDNFTHTITRLMCIKQQQQNRGLGEFFKGKELPVQI